MSLTDLNVDQITASRDNLFTSVRLDRLAELRDDPEWVENALNSEAATLVPLWRSRCLLRQHGDDTQPVYLTATDLDGIGEGAHLTLLGDDGRHTWFALALNDAQRDRLLEKHPGAAFHDLRLTIDLDDRHAGVLAYARALLYWHYRNAHCGFCGAPSRSSHVCETFGTITCCSRATR